MRRTSTFIHVKVFLLVSAAWSFPFTGAGQGIYSGKDVAASVMVHRDANTQVLPKGIDKSWYNEAVAKIEEREFFIRTLDRPGVFGAVNHPQHLTYLFNTDGYSVSNFYDTKSANALWQSRFIIGGIGRSGKFHQQQLRSVNQVGDLGLHYEYNSYAVDYSNKREGMEQSFVIREKATGHRQLQIALDLEGDLQARLSGDDQLLLYTKGHPEDVKLVYDQLKAWDKKGTKLSSKMVVTGPHSLVLYIDDSKAVYPITVDPLNHTPSGTYTLGTVVNPSIDETLNPVLGGYTLAGVGDVNGDGNGDIVIGAPLFTHIVVGSGLSATGTAVGAAFVFYGVHLAMPSTMPSQVLQPTGLANGALFGFSVSGGGNIDGDAKMDFVVGAPGDQSFNFFDFSNLNSGKVYGYRGANMGPDVLVIPAPAVTLAVNGGAILSNNPLYGFSVAIAGDMDGDGFDDIIVGCPGWNSGTGKIDIFRGTGTSAMFGGSPDKTVNGILTGTLFGFSVSGAGDVNNDNLSDIIVGAPGELVGLSVTTQGGAYVFHGNGATSCTSANDANGASGANGTAITGTGGALFGYSVSNAGDVDKDGNDDVVIGEPLALDHGAAAGLAFVYYGSSNALGIGSTFKHATLHSPRSATALGGTTPLNLLFGFSVGTAGNAVGDAASDIIVGEPGSKLILNSNLSTTFSALGLSIAVPTLVYNGAAYIFNGNVSTGIATNAAPFWTLQNSVTLTAATADLLGASVHYAGDVNGDLLDDLLIGSPSGALDLGINLAIIPTNASLTLALGLVSSGSIGNIYLFLGFSVGLPVTLLDFTGTAVDGTTVLNWSTAQEQNSAHYDIQRSTDGSNFSSIGQVAAANNSTSKTDYTYTDAAPLTGTDYYRLKMVDLDGQFTYSKIVAVNFLASGPAAVAAYPNPAHDNFHLVFKNMTPGLYRMSMLSVAGQEVLSKNIQVSNPVNQSESVNLPVLAPGSYWIRLIDEKNHSFLSRMEIR